MKLDNISNQIIISASQEAEKRSHEYITPEHILYSSLFYSEGSNIIYNCGGNIKKLKEDLKEYFDNHIPKTKNKEPLESKGFQNVLNNTAMHAINAGQEIISIGDILVSIFQEKNSFAVYCMQKQGIDKLDILNYICHGISQIVEDSIEEAKEYEDYDYNDKINQNKEKEDKTKKFLSQFTTDLTYKAKQNKLDPVIKRDQTIKRTIQILCRRVKNNPIHVGEPGIGKTSITEGLASWIVNKKVPEILKNHKILKLEMSTVVAGTKYRGEFEERLQYLLKTISKLKNIILYIDEIHTIVGAGAVSGSSMDASNIIKPFLNKSDIKCIGATTNEEYKKYFEKDKALSRRFQKVEVTEPSPEECIEILKGLKSKYEIFHKLKYSPQAIEKAVSLSIKYINDRFLPDKAIDILDETAAFIKVYKENNKETIIKPKDIEKTISLITKMPLETISNTEIQRLSLLEQNLKKTIFGQNQAIEKVVQAIHQSRAGFNEDNKPIASLLFVGATGVGKTELSYQIAKTLNIPIIRFDMSEYQEKHSISKLIGSPPGYVGYEEGGILIDQVKLNPYSVILLDEIEKAHPDIFNILLQVMDYATITDKTGKKADFKNTIIIMTSNAGAREVGKNLLGFDERKIDCKFMEKEINNIFTPEFRNRLNKIIRFNYLNKEMALKIVKKEISKLKSKLKKKNINLKITNNVYSYIANQGLNSNFGARQINRAIEEKIKSPLVKEVLFGTLKNGGNSVISIKNKKIIIKNKEKEL